MITTPKAEKADLAYEIARWKGISFAEALSDAQVVIDSLLTKAWSTTVRHHPMTEWVANHFMVHWRQASFALGGLFPAPTAPTAPSDGWDVVYHGNPVVSHNHYYITDDYEEPSHA